LCHKKYSFFLVAKPITICIIGSSRGEKVMLNDFEDVNRILAELADEGTLEPMIEPIDDPTCDPMDWAEVTGLVDEVFDEMYLGAELVDENGCTWYVS